MNLSVVQVVPLFDGMQKKIAFNHHYLNNTGSSACTGMVQIMTQPNLVNETLLFLKTFEYF